LEKLEESPSGTSKKAVDEMGAAYWKKGRRVGGRLQRGRGIFWKGNIRAVFIRGRAAQKGLGERQTKKEEV